MSTNVRRLPVQAKRNRAMAPEPPVGQRVALVTGASRGIGLEVARQLAATGVTVFLGVRELGKGEKLARSIRETGGDAFAVRLDVTKQGDIDAAVAHIDGRFGRLDILVNNAGGYFDHDGLPSKADVDTVRGALEVNLIGAWSLSAAVVPLMRRHGYGRIVNVSSECAVRTMCGENSPAYRVSKAALNAYTQALARELTGSGILVNAVCPGWTATRLGGSGGRPVEESAQGIVWAALLSDREATTGEFFRDRVKVAW